MEYDVKPPQVQLNANSQLSVGEIYNPNYRRSITRLRPWTWFLCDYIVAYICANIAFALTPHALNDVTATGEHVGQSAFSFGLALVVALVSHIYGLQEQAQRKRSVSLLGRCCLVALVALLIVNAELLLVHYLKVGRLISIITFFSCAAGLFLSRALFVGLANRSYQMIGCVGTGSYIDHALKFDDEESENAGALQVVTLNIEDSPNAKLTEWVKQNGVNQVVVDTEANYTQAQAEELVGLINNGLIVSTYTSFIENLFERVPNEHINARWVIDCQANDVGLYSIAVKRLLDIVVAAIALVCLAPLLLIAAIAIRLDGKGPVIFQQIRVGQHRKNFNMLKLRTMNTDAENDGEKWATDNDPRITRVGHFLRMSRLDEAPQLINVLAGDMSLVGPRPEVPALNAELASQIPFFEQRTVVKPGITGWAQINSGYAASVEESARKLSYDLYYVKTVSFGMDLRILLRTISSFAKGAR